MKQLKDYVCTLDKSKELKELGVIQKPIWNSFWEEAVLPKRAYLTRVLPLSELKPFEQDFAIKQGEYKWRYAAFTSGELGVALGMNGDESVKSIAYSLLGVCEKFQSDNEAGDRADVLIRAIKAGRISVEEVNKRLSGE